MTEYVEVRATPIAYPEKGEMQMQSCGHDPMVIRTPPTQEVIPYVAPTLETRYAPVGPLKPVESDYPGLANPRP